jgi:hypothetical protein
MAITMAEYSGPAGTSFRGGDNTQKLRRVYLQITCTGNYAGAPGDAMDFTTLGEIPHSSYAPVFALFTSLNPSGNSGYFYSYVPAATPTLSNGFFQVLRCGGVNTVLADLGAGAYPAGVTGDTIVGYVDFIRL